MSALPLPPSRNTSEKHSVSTVAGFAGLIIIAKRAATSFWPPGDRGSRISLQVTRQLPIAITEPHGIGLGRSAKK
jgi:hypothetical protein